MSPKKNDSRETIRFKKLFLTHFQAFISNTDHEKVDFYEKAYFKTLLLDYYNKCNIFNSICDTVNHQEKFDPILYEDDSDNIDLDESDVNDGLFDVYNAINKNNEINNMKPPQIQCGSNGSPQSKMTTIANDNTNGNLGDNFNKNKKDTLYEIKNDNDDALYEMNNNNNDNDNDDDALYEMNNNNNDNDNDNDNDDDDTHIPGIMFF